VFGLSFTEILVLCVVGIVVVGPRKLPTLMRTTGQWISKLRGMSRDLRDQAGIDELIRAEGLEKEIRELRSLSRTNVIETLVNNASKKRPALPAAALAAGDKGESAKSGETKTKGEAKAAVGPQGTVAGSAPNRARAALGPPSAAVVAVAARLDPPRDREYPVLGCDHYDALPEDLDHLEEAEGDDGEAEPEASAEDSGAEGRADGDSEEAQP